jgi:hypothetical protein
MINKLGHVSAAFCKLHPFRLKGTTMLQNYYLRTSSVPVVKEKKPARRSLVFACIFFSVSLMGCEHINIHPEETKHTESASPAKSDVAQHSVAESEKLLDKGIKLVQQKKPEAGIPLIRKAIALKSAAGKDDRLAEMYGNLAWACECAHNLPAAEEAYSKGLEIASPSFPFRKDFEMSKNSVHYRSEAKNTSKKVGK